MPQHRLKEWVGRVLLVWLRHIYEPFTYRRAPTFTGQGLVEYALLIVFIALIVLIVVALLGPWTGNVFSNIINNI